MNATAQQAGAGPHNAQKAPRKPSVIGAWGPRIVLIAVGAVTLISIGFVLFGASGDAIGRIIFTDLALLAFGLLVWTDALIGRYRPDWFEVTSMAADAYTLLIWVGIIWLGTPDATDVFLGIYVLVVVRLALLHLDLIRWLMKRMSSQLNRVIGGIAIASISAFFVMLTLPCLEIFGHFWDIDIYGRIVASLAILGSMSTILIPLTALLYNRKPKNLDAPRQTQPVASTGYGAPVQPGTSAAPAQPAPYGAPAQFPQTPQDFAYVAGSPLSGTAQATAAPISPDQVAPDAATGIIGTPPAASTAPTPEAPSVPAAEPTPPTPAYDTPSVPPAAAGPSRAWPRLVDGTPLPANAEGSPDFSALRPGHQLAWPTFVDGTPVPANPDGTPLAMD